MKILSYNVNGIRAAANKGLFEFLKLENPDVVLFQEIKATQEQILPEWYESLGYQAVWHSAEKKGYSGVGILYKGTIKGYEIGCGNAKYDAEGRFLRIDFEHYSIVSLYLPSGTSGDERQAFKMETLGFFLNYFNQLKQTIPNLILGGDFNICRQPIDIHDPVRNKDVSGFKPEERAWFDQFLKSGWIDTFRLFYPEEKHRYSWWTFRAGARGNNKGWRIDYILATESMRNHLKHADILHHIVHSDHCPVTLEIN